MNRISTDELELSERSCHRLKAAFREDVWNASGSRQDESSSFVRRRR